MEELKNKLEALEEYIIYHEVASGGLVIDSKDEEKIKKGFKDIKDYLIELEKTLNHNGTSETFTEPTKPTGNMVNHPAHYQSQKVNGNSLECIEVMKAVKGWYKTALFCELNAFKYNWRLGNKDNIPTELGKIKWYSEKATELWRLNLSWFYPKNQHIYAIIDEVKMKDPTTGEWGDALLYTDGKGNYVRDKVDFINKFKET